MRSRKSALPIIIFIGLALVAVLGIVVLNTSATSAAMEVNNSSRDNLPLAVNATSSYFVEGIAVILFIIAIYFAVKFIR